MMDDNSSKETKVGRGAVRGVIADAVTRWFHTEDRPEAQEAREGYAAAVQRWFARQSDWIKGRVLDAAHNVSLLVWRREETRRLAKYKAGPNDPPHPLLDGLVAGLAEKFGGPRIEEAKVIGWHVNDRLDIILQKDQNWGLYIWMPWPLNVELNGITEVYEAGRGRHSGSYRLPSLGRGRAALKIKVANERHRRWAMELIEKVDGKG